MVAGLEGLDERPQHAALCRSPQKDNAVPLVPVCGRWEWWCGGMSYQPSISESWEGYWPVVSLRKDARKRRDRKLILQRCSIYLEQAHNRHSRLRLCVENLLLIRKQPSQKNDLDSPLRHHLGPAPLTGPLPHPPSGLP